MTTNFKDKVYKLVISIFFSLALVSAATASARAQASPQTLALDLYWFYACDEQADTDACSALETWQANLAGLDTSRPLDIQLTASDIDGGQIVKLSDVFNMLDESSNFDLEAWADQLTFTLDDNAHDYLGIVDYDIYQYQDPWLYYFVSYQSQGQTNYAVQTEVRVLSDEELRQYAYWGQEEIVSYALDTLNDQMSNYSGTNLEAISISVSSQEILLISTFNPDTQEYKTQSLSVTTDNLATATPYITYFTAIGQTAEVIDEQGNVLATSYNPEDGSFWMLMEDFTDITRLTSSEKGLGEYSYNITTADHLQDLQTLTPDPDTGEFSYDFDHIITDMDVEGENTLISEVNIAETKFTPAGGIALVNFIADYALLDDGGDPDAPVINLDAVALTVTLAENVTASVSYDQQEQQPVLALGDDTAAAILMLSGSLDESIRALNLPESNLQITGSLSSVNYDIEVEVDASGEVSTYTSATTSETIDPDTQAAIIADLITTGGDITITTREGEIAVLTATDEHTAQKRLYYFAAKAGQSLTTTADILTVAELTRNIIALVPADINSVYVGLSDGMQELESLSTLAENSQIKTVSYNALTVSTDSEALKELLPAVASQTPAAASISIHATRSSDETKTLSIFGITSPSADVFATVKQAVSEDSTVIVQLLALESVSGQMHTARSSDAVVSATISTITRVEDDQLTLSITGTGFTINIQNGAIYAVIFTATTTREQVESAIAGSQGQFMVYFGSTYMLARDGKLYEIATPANDQPAAPTSDPNDRHASSRNVPNNARPQGCDASLPIGQADLFQIDRRADKATLYFTPVRDNTDRYHVMFGYSEGDERFSGIALQVSSEQNNGVLALDVTNLDPRLTYSFKVAPVHDCAVGTWSAWLTAGPTTASRVSHTYRYANEPAKSPSLPTSSLTTKAGGEGSVQIVTAKYSPVTRKH